MIYNIFAELNEMICSHGRSYEYFTDSIRATLEQDCNFSAVKWNLNYNSAQDILDIQCEPKDTCIEMGINAIDYRFRAQGPFFTVTGKNQPFCS